MVNLQDKFAKTDALSATELRQDLAKFKWKEGADPENFLKGLMNVDILSTNLANDSITERKLCSRLFMAAPKKYLPILQGVRKEHKEKLTLYFLEEEINETHCIEHLGESDEEIDDDNEVTESALITPGSGSTRRFRGECCKCVKKGNRAFEFIYACSNTTQV